MSTLVWISGASAGIGAALAASVPYPDARVIDISRTGGTTDHQSRPAGVSGTADDRSRPEGVAGGGAGGRSRSEGVAGGGEGGRSRSEGVAGGGEGGRSRSKGVAGGGEGGRSRPEGVAGDGEGGRSRPEGVAGGGEGGRSRPEGVAGGAADDRRGPARFAGGTAEHFKADLAEPADWSRLAAHFADELAAYGGERVVFIHNAGTINPIGPAAGAEPDAYRHAVLLNSAAPQVLGAAFLRATAELTCERHLVMLSSGAAKTAYAGWSSYNAGKAAVEHWVRTVGQEQPADGCRVIAVAPGVVDTAMQSEIRATDETDFPSVGRFHELERTGALSTPEAAATGIWSLLTRDLPNGSCVDLRNL